MGVGGVSGGSPLVLHGNQQTVEKTNISQKAKPDVTTDLVVNGDTKDKNALATDLKGAIAKAKESGATSIIMNSGGKSYEIDLKKSGAELDKVIADVAKPGFALSGKISFTENVVAPPKKEAMVPAQTTGRQTDNFVTAQFKDDAEAKKGFEAAKTKMLNPNGWEKTADAGAGGMNMGAGFQLVDKQGNAVTGRGPQVGDRLRIDLPDGVKNNDLVEIEAITITPNSVEIRVRCDPDKDGSHFYSNETTNTFSLKQEGNKVSFSVSGRNETFNTGGDSKNSPGVGGFFEMVGDFGAGVAKQVGADMSDGQNAQWKNLGKGLFTGTATTEVKAATPNNTSTLGAFGLGKD